MTTKALRFTSDSLPLCLEDGCSKIAHYSHESLFGGKVATLCHIHKLRGSNFVNQYRTHCWVAHCKSTPSNTSMFSCEYHHPSKITRASDCKRCSYTGKLCPIHRDIIENPPIIYRCSIENCVRIGKFAIDEECTRVYCYAHRKKNSKIVSANLVCMFEDCDRCPNFIIIGTNLGICKKHMSYAYLPLQPIEIKMDDATPPVKVTDIQPLVEPIKRPPPIKRPRSPPISVSPTVSPVSPPTLSALLDSNKIDSKKIRYEEVYPWITFPTGFSPMLCTIPPPLLIPPDDLMI
jgi:hypothetical protein